jgi:hypothetical protein
MGVVLAEIGHTPHKNGNKKVRVILYDRYNND